LVFVVASYAAFFVAMMGYFWNNAFLSVLSRGGENAGFASFGVALEFVVENFLGYLLNSPFFLFTLSLLLGWVSFVVIRRYWPNDTVVFS
ncbi:MAG: hypothetical protein AABY11_00840, partial [archaeon]